MGIFTFLAILISANSLPADISKLAREFPDSSSVIWLFWDKLDPQSLKNVELYGGRIRTVSHWLNGVSVFAPNSVIEQIFNKSKASDASFVAKAKVMSDERVAPPDFQLLYDPSEYGPSYEQVHTIRADKLHEKGIFGSGVRIGVFDTGFDSTHPAIKHIWERGHVLATHNFAVGDFINSSFGQVPTCYRGTVKYVNSLDFDLSQNYLAVVYSVATDAALSGGLRNRWAIWMTTGQISGNSVHWLDTLLLVPPDSFAIKPSVVLQDSLVLLAYQAKSFNREFEIYFAKFTISGTQLISPQAISNSYGNSINPLLFARNDSIFILWFEDYDGLTMRISDDGGHSFDLYTIVFPKYGEYGGLSGTWTDEGIRIAISIDDSIWVGDPMTGNFEFVAIGNLPDLKSRQIHPLVLAYVRNDSIFTKFWDGSTWTSERFWTKSMRYIGPQFNPDESDGSVVFVDTLGRLAKLTEGAGAELVDSEFVDLIVLKKGQMVWRRRGNTDVYPENYIPHTMGPKYHGTKVLSVIAGFYSRELIGVAPAAEFLLARTERTVTTGGVSFENQIEEDFWIEALEWAVNRGARVISSSLGYSDWYRKDQLDGRTAPISRAASTALERNALVVTAMGNVRHETFPDPEVGDTTLVAPADADGIIAVGGYALLPDSNILIPKGSYGPAADGRIKPEVIAPWWTYAAADTIYGSDTLFPTLFLTFGGTSFGTALTAGAVALVMEAHPEWSAEQVREAILNTAKPVEIPGWEGAAVPNNVIGHGLLDAYAAAQPLEFESKEEYDYLLDPYPNPFVRGLHTELKFPYVASKQSFAKLLIFNISGELVREIDLGKIYVGRDVILWDGRDNSGNLVPPGLYFATLKTGFSVSTVKFAVK